MRMPKKPNILIILLDQVQRAVTQEDSPCHMPVVKAFARRAVVFDHHLTCSAHCCPARATFLTGLYPSRHGVINNVETDTAVNTGLRPGVRTLPQYLQEADYLLSYSGKYHISNDETPADRGWHEVTPFHKVDPPKGRDRWQPDTVIRDSSGGERPSATIRRPGWGDTIRAQGHEPPPPDVESTYWYPKAIGPGVEELRRLGRQDAAWCLCISPDMGPNPAVPEDILALYDIDDIAPPASFADDLTDKPNVYRRMRSQYWDQLSEEEVRRAMAQYWANCTLQDRYVEEILTALDETGQADDTLVVFLSDHGERNFAHGMQGMATASFREGYEVPLMMRWPAGIRNTGRHVDAFVNISDVLPTLLEVAGLPVPDGLTGRSLMPFLHGETPADWRDDWCSQNDGHEIPIAQRAVTTRQWKYVYNAFDFDELYDLEADPDEMINLAHPDRWADVPAPDLVGPWPPLPRELDDVRKEMLIRLWRFALKENDNIFNGYLASSLVPYGPMIALECESSA
jgi:arylsulfatase A-like enzyme